MLKDILENAVPVTFQDVVVTFCTVTGWRNGQLVQISDARKIYHQKIGGENWSAIQITTAAGVCAVLDLHLRRPAAAARVRAAGTGRLRRVPRQPFRQALRLADLDALRRWSDVQPRDVARAGLSSFLMRRVPERKGSGL